MSNNIENRTETRKEDYGTPQDLFDELNDIFDFEVDLAAWPNNAKCNKYYSPADNFFSKPITDEMCYCNPPYNKEYNEMWVQKLMQYPNIVVLHQASVGAKWFRDFWRCADILCFLPRRLKFVGAKNGGSAQFDSVLAVKLSDYEMIKLTANDLEEIGHVVRNGATYR